MLLYTNKKQLYTMLKITRYEFENMLNRWEIIICNDIKWNLKGYIIKQDILKAILW